MRTKCFNSVYFKYSTPAFLREIHTILMVVLLLIVVGEANAFDMSAFKQVKQLLNTARTQRHVERTLLQLLACICSDKMYRKIGRPGQ